MKTALSTLSLLATVLSTLSLGACDDPERTFAEDVEIDEDDQTLTVQPAAEPGAIDQVDTIDALVAPTDPSAIPPDGWEPDEPAPDLVIDAYSGFQLGILKGYWYAWFRVKNRGDATAPASMAGILLLDDWNNPDPGGVRLGSVPQLAPGASAWVKINFAAACATIPGYTDIGCDTYDIINYQTRFFADRTFVVAESSETNNTYTMAW